jgi:hypothetical protein
MRTSPWVFWCSSFHCQFGGRPLITAVLQEVLQYISRFPDVWFARHEELGRWALAADVDEHSYASRFFGEDAGATASGANMPSRRRSGAERPAP